VAIVLITAFLASLTTPAPGPDGDLDETWRPSSYGVLVSPSTEIDLEPSAPLTMADEEVGGFSIGPAGGYLRARGSDRGTWFGGVQARLRLLNILAAEASITFHQNHYENNDIIVTQYPVQLTAMLYIIPVGPVRPYILGGVGWYYTRIDYRDDLSGIDDETDHFFGVHLGVGVELMLGRHASIDVDVRYIFINATNQQVIDRDFNYWQITFGLNFIF
jgi:opacity protein-like surface antigen